MKELIFMLIGIVFLAGCTTQQTQLTGKVVEPSQTPKEQVRTESKCSSSYLNQYTCSDNYRYQLYQYSNCSLAWFYLEYCTYGCSSERCLQKSTSTIQPTIQETQTTTTPSVTTQNTTNVSTWQIQPKNITEPYIQSSTECKGSALCSIGTVDKIIDGDTLVISGYSIRLALTSTPESYQTGGTEATSFTANLCKVGSKALIDEDDGQLEGSYGRIVAVVYCQNKTLNAELLYNGLAQIDTRFCSASEFANEEWAKNHCFPTTVTSNETKEECHPSYPTVCIPYPPPDLDCPDIPYRNFQVLPPDPHRFDRDKDGVGCES